jgi:hypothetical protein
VREVPGQRYPNRRRNALGTDRRAHAIVKSRRVVIGGVSEERPMSDYFQTIAEAVAKLINSKPSSQSVEELKDTLPSAVANLAAPEEPPICEHADEHDGAEDE